MLDNTQIPFEVTSAADHAERMIFDIVGLTTAITDLNEGGALRSLAEALAIQLEDLDSKMFFGTQRSIPASLFVAFNFGKLSAVKATGTVTLNRASNSFVDVLIPKGSTVIAPAIGTLPEATFATLADAIMVLGKNSIDIPIAAVIPGSASNVSAGRITVLGVTIGHIASIINYAAIKNGMDEETEDQRQVRFRKYVTNLARAQLQGIEVGAMTAQLLDTNGLIVEKVQKAIAIEPGNSLGRVQVYVDNGGGTCSPELVALAQQIIDGYKNLDGSRVVGYRAAGIVATVSAIQTVAVPVTAKIDIETGYAFTDVQPDVQDAIENFFFGLEPGQEMIEVDLLTAIASVPGVRDVVLVTPTGNLNAASNQRLLAGTITLTEF